MARLPDPARSEAGFSLLEILVAVFVFSLVASASVMMMSTAITSEEVARAAMDRVAQLDRVRTVLRDDLGQVVARPTRDADGLTSAYVFAAAETGIPDLADRDETVVLAFTRRGAANPGRLRPRSSLLRVEYLLEENQLVRRIYGYPDPTQETDIQTDILLDGVEAFELEILSGTSWTRSFLVPPSGSNTSLPRAVRLRYEMPGFGEIEHVLITPGGAFAS